jgi:hypothetical protein
MDQFSTLLNRRRYKQVALSAASLVFGTCGVALLRGSIGGNGVSASSSSLPQRLNPDLPADVQALIKDGRIASNMLPRLGKQSQRSLSECSPTVWHMSVQPDEHDTCTNSGVVPDSWNIPAMAPYLFFDDPESCCIGYFGAGYTCNIVEGCGDNDMEEKSAVITRSPTPKSSPRPSKKPVSPPPSVSPVTSDPSESQVTSPPSTSPITSAPFANPVTPAPVGVDSTQGEGCDKLWHISTQTGATYTCTNDAEFPDVWSRDGMKANFLFATADECCQRYFSGQECIQVDTCGLKDNSCHEWHISTAAGDAGVCSNSKDYPSVWKSQGMAENYILPSSVECCSRFFGGECSSVVDVCSGDDVGGASTIAPSRARTRAPITPNPTRTSKPSQSPTTAVTGATSAPVGVDSTQGEGCDKLWHISTQTGATVSSYAYFIISNIHLLYYVFIVS